MEPITKKVIAVSFVIFFLLIINLPALTVIAANYQLLEPSIVINTPSASETSKPSFADYLRNAYVIMFVLVITSVVFWFIMGGLEYIMSDSLNAKLGGKAKIKSALIGLVIALTSYILLNLINPDLLKFKLNLNP